MLGKIIITAGTVFSVAAAAIAFQSPANAADIKFTAHTGTHGVAIHQVRHKANNHHGFKSKGIVHKKIVKSKKSHFVKKPLVKKHIHKKPRFVKKFVHKPHVLSNREIRFYLRKKGLYNIHFVNRHHGVAKVVAYSRRGFVGKYIINARNARIIDRDILRYL